MSSVTFKLLSSTAIRRADHRGYLDVLHEEEQIVLKRSFSRAGVFRGMHWQRPPYSQIKLVRVVKGRILDFIVDPGSAKPVLCYREFTPEDNWIKIDAHLAHGIYAMEDSEFEYICYGSYNEAAEDNYSVIDFLRVHLGIVNPILSIKDSKAPKLNIINGIENN
jgi:dTDP-4-dehydrorhamnose 3,5-epimerase